MRAQRVGCSKPRPPADESLAGLTSTTLEHSCCVHDTGGESSAAFCKPIAENGG
jgi:hypothetical protein